MNHDDSLDITRRLSKEVEVVAVGEELIWGFEEFDEHDCESCAFQDECDVKSRKYNTEMPFELDGKMVTAIYFRQKYKLN